MADDAEDDLYETPEEEEAEEEPQRPRRSARSRVSARTDRSARGKGRAKATMLTPEEYEDWQQQDRRASRRVTILVTIITLLIIAGAVVLFIIKPPGAELPPWTAPYIPLEIVNQQPLNNVRSELVQAGNRMKQELPKIQEALVFSHKAREKLTTLKQTLQGNSDADAELEWVEEAEAFLNEIQTEINKSLSLEDQKNILASIKYLKIGEHLKHVRNGVQSRNPTMRLMAESRLKMAEELLQEGRAEAQRTNNERLSKKLDLFEQTLKDLKSQLRP